MKPFKILAFLIFLLAAKGYGQDIIVKANGDVVRGTIKATNYTSVKYALDDGQEIIEGIKDIKQFVWNGETYVIKTFFNKKKAEDRFVKIVETGKVNLYAIGGQNVAAEPKQSKVKIRPTFGIGTGGGGVGGTISIGGGRQDDVQSPGGGKTFYFIERPGTGALQEINPGDTNKTRELLLQKLGDDEDLAGRIKVSEDFTSKSLEAFVKAYNEMHK